MNKTGDYRITKKTGVNPSEGRFTAPIGDKNCGIRLIGNGLIYGIPFNSKPISKTIDERRKNVFFIDPENGVIEIFGTIPKVGIEIVNFNMKLGAKHGRDKKSGSKRMDEIEEKRNHEKKRKICMV
jgi:hypothetical protein